jgi:hypothetical protein
MMPEEFTDEDLSMMQSMMKSNIADNRNLYAAVPPAIVGAGRGEAVMLNQPSTQLPADEQQYLASLNAQEARDELSQPPLDARSEARGPRPVDSKLVQAMAAALRPDLAQFQRPGRRSPDYTSATIPDAGEDETVNPDGTVSKDIRRR